MKRGIGRTFQINQLFKGLSVIENVIMGVSEREGGRATCSASPAAGAS